MLNQEVEDGELSSEEEVRSNKNDNQKNSNTDRKRSESGELDDLEDQEKNPYEEEDVITKNEYFFLSVFNKEAYCEYFVNFVNRKTC